MADDREHRIRTPKRERVRRTLTRLDDETLSGLARILRAGCTVAPDMEAVEGEILDLFHGLELADDGTEASRIWFDLGAAEPPDGALANAFAAAAAAGDPIAAVRADDNLAPGLNGMLDRHWRVRWRRMGREDAPSLRTVTWEALTPEARAEVRQMLRDLADHARGFVRRGQPRRTDLDDALRGLGEIFLRHCGDRNHAVHALPYARDSRFIGFAALALRAVAHPSATSPAALSERWRRLLSAQHEAAEDHGREQPDRTSCD
ncbi:hypothetical protein LNKW23_48520 [Paralimibaculum aggregatum]|uniref:Uncharacterized protein n=1 Tax=Paralimibaculum aggregatum TaxID=3036245 RepID=A0ABQ6LU69_9RHOB|nr:hypothetical protein [Limibaculum sp. NKW23]GMG85629.1 hypothetical protein LNKW23_48520 [Limibaculum sp. NKW23]